MPAQLVEAGVRGHPVEPGRESGPTVEAVDAAGHGHEGLLGGVERVGLRGAATAGRSGTRAAGGGAAAPPSPPDHPGGAAGELLVGEVLDRAPVSPEGSRALRPRSGSSRPPRSAAQLDVRHRGPVADAGRCQRVDPHQHRLAPRRVRQIDHRVWVSALKLATGSPQLSTPVELPARSAT